MFSVGHRVDDQAYVREIVESAEEEESSSADGLDDSGRDPVWWTPRKRECSSWEANVGSSLLSTKMKQ